MKDGTMTRPTWRTLVVLVAVAPVLAGCGDSVKRAFGWEKSSPDEFTVVTRAPLTQPPDFDLRPPAPGSIHQQEGQTSTVEQAKKVLMGPDGVASPRPASNKDNPALADLTSGEQMLLRKAGAENASPDVRRQVDEETTALVKGSGGFADDLLFWQDKPKPGEVLDPTKESQRLESNSSLGKAVTEGDTPQIVRRQKGWLEGIF